MQCYNENFSPKMFLRNDLHFGMDKSLFVVGACWRVNKKNNRELVVFLGLLS